MTLRIIIFLALNFGALALGGLATSSGVSSEWYEGLNKAPWTPPGWVFGAAWTLIMICFSVYMAMLWPTFENKKTILFLFIIQWVLNVSWNPIFFSLHQVGLGFVVILLLTILIGFFLFKYWSQVQYKSLLVLPYFVWLIIASSLNGYILFFNK